MHVSVTAVMLMVTRVNPMIRQRSCEAGITELVKPAMND